jgi:hypothetical protein
MPHLPGRQQAAHYTHANPSKAWAAVHGLDGLGSAKIGLQLAGGLIYELTPPLPPFPPFRFALMVRCRIDSVMTPWRS